MKPVFIPPAGEVRPRRTFEVRLGDSIGAVVGSIQADTFLQAAGYASRQFFHGSGVVQRATGWGDAPGTWLDTKEGREPVLFYLAEPGVTAQHPLESRDAQRMAPFAHYYQAPKPKPQPKRKRR
jgi:hypothetical protein